MDKKIDLNQFLHTLRNRTNEKGKGVILKHGGKPVAVLLTYEDYLEINEFIQTKISNFDID